MGMKHYKLLKDTPTIKAGTIFEEVTSDFDELKELVRVTPIGAKTSPQFTIQDIDNFDEWFEEMEEPTDSIHWKPKDGEEYWYIGDDSSIRSIRFSSYDGDDVNRLAIGNVYLTKAEAICVRERKLAEVRLRKTSTFEPDFEGRNGGWVVGYNYHLEEFAYVDASYVNYGEPVRYATEEDAKKSIRENERDWKIFFGIKEEE